MRLQEFITNSITEIITGVKNSQEFAEKNGARVNPSSIKLIGNNKTTYWDDFNKMAGQEIEFDILVTIKEEGQTEGKAGIFVTFLKAGISDKDSTENIISNRIRFSVPIFLPIQNIENGK